MEPEENLTESELFLKRDPPHPPADPHGQTHGARWSRFGEGIESSFISDKVRFFGALTAQEIVSTAHLFYWRVR